MEKISQVMTWQKQQGLRGEIELTGTFKILSMSTIERYVIGDARVEAAAKDQAARRVHNALYGEVQSKLAELERLMLSTPPGDLMWGNGPAEKLWEIQDLINSYK